MRTDNAIGVATRNDFLPEIGLHKTEDRQRLSTVSADRVRENTIGVFAQSAVRLAEKFRIIPGLRADLFHFDVHSDTAENSGTRTDTIVSPKLEAVAGPWEKTEFYLGLGTGFHSNDARGTTITRDPVSGDPVAKVDPLVRSRGAEIGVRSTAIKDLHTTLAVWYLAIGSELVYAGDSGVDEPSAPSRRLGVEWTNFWTPLPGWAIDVDYAWTHARLTDYTDGANRIPDSVEQVLAAGISYGLAQGWFGALRARYFGPRPLIEDNSVRSDATLLFNASLGYRWQRVTAQIEVLNLFNSKNHDIDYFYQSRLASEGAGVDDVHFHPVEPLSVRGTVSVNF